MDNKRIEYLDVIKFISIVLVIFCHNPILKPNSVVDNLLMLLCWAAVPMFFMSTGAIYLNREFEFDKWIKRILKIYIVLIVWKLIYLVFFAIYKDINILEVSKGAIIQYIFLFGEINWVQAGHMWFMYAYIMVMLIYPLILKCFQSENKEYKRFLEVMLIIIFAFVFVKSDMNIVIQEICTKFNKNVFNLNTISQVFPFGTYANMLFFFIIGGYLRKYKVEDKFGKKKTIIFSLIAIIVGLLELLLIRYSYTRTFTWDGKYLNNGYFYMATSILAISLFILIQTLDLKTNRIINVIATNTLGIFYIHFIILNILARFFTKYGTIYNLIKTFVVLIICTIICYIMKKIKILKEIF